MPNRNSQLAGVCVSPVTVSMGIAGPNTSPAATAAITPPGSLKNSAARIIGTYMVWNRRSEFLP